jgi:cysteine-rich repeat protein
MRVSWKSVCGLLAFALLTASEARAQVHCTATFKLDDAVTIGALQLHVDYPTPDAAFDGSSSSVACTNLAPALPNFQDDDAGRLSMAYVAPGAGFTGPRNLASCTMTTTAGITKDDLTVTVTDATSPSFQALPLPSVSARVFCDGDTSTTTSTSTTTTTLSQNTVCDVTVDLAQAITVGSLQVVVGYGNADGEFGGTASAAQCTTLVGNALATYYDDESARTVTSAIISLAGLAGPKSLFKCVFTPGAVTPVSGDFSISVTDAGDTDSSPIFPRPSVVISNIACVDPTATTTTTSTLAVCGNGIVEGSEECDDGNLAAYDGCGPTCLFDTLCGDADRNQKLTAVDAQRILRASVGLSPACPLVTCDTSGDGSLTVGDAQRVLRRSVGLSAPLLCL